MNGTELFKVIAISDNTNGFGLRGVVLSSREGWLIECAASELNVPKIGTNYELHLNEKSGSPINPGGFERWRIIQTPETASFKKGFTSKEEYQSAWDKIFVE